MAIYMAIFLFLVDVYWNYEILCEKREDHPVDGERNRAFFDPLRIAILLRIRESVTVYRSGLYTLGQCVAFDFSGDVSGACTLMEIREPRRVSGHGIACLRAPLRCPRRRRTHRTYDSSASRWYRVSLRGICPGAVFSLEFNFRNACLVYCIESGLYHS